MNNFHFSCVSNNVWAIIRWNEYEWRANTYAERQSDFLKMKYFKYHNYLWTKPCEHGLVHWAIYFR